MSESDAAIDPYQYYAYLRAESPVSRMPDDGLWQVACHADVNQLLRDNKTFSSEVAVRAPEDEDRRSMLFSDPPIHNRLRKLVSVAFKPSHIARQQTLIEQRCEVLMKEMCQHSQVDLVPALASPLPVTVIAEMLGVSDGDMLAFKRWSDVIFSNIGDILFAEPSPEAAKASVEMDEYFIGRINEIRERPASHLLGRLVATETDEGMLNDEELLSFCRLLLIAGNETTTGLITAAVRVFDEIPETFVRLKQDPSLIPTFIEETLRYYSPFSATIRRTTCDTVLGGVTIPKGDLVMPLIASANRDEAVFDSAETFVIDRDPNPHLAFGFGIHFCLGAHLARLEGEVAIASMVKHLEQISLVEKDHSQMSGLGGPSELLVKLAVASA